jgi:hypothetical protein
MFLSTFLVQNNEMAETVTCSKSVLLKLKTMSESTHIKQIREIAEKNRDYITCTS